MCKFLHEINPNFVIRINSPSPKWEERDKKRPREADEIALRYFSKVDRNFYFSKQVKYTIYLIEEDERGRLDIIKSHEHIRIKKGEDF